MKISRQVSLKMKTVSQLGFRQSANFMLYRLGLKSGYFKLLTPAIEINSLLSDNQLKPNWFLGLPERADLLRISGSQIQTCLAEADGITARCLRYFGGEEKPLDLAPEKNPLHWTRYESGSARRNVEDIKYVWEPARFEWAIQLGKAYYFSNDEKYAGAFWQFYEEFRQANPPNSGLNWTSAQEVALRLIALVICAHLLKDSPASSDRRMSALVISIADHATRIPPTLSYAKAQNNNHLLSEALGLYTAGIFLPDHPNASKWREQGLHYFNQVIRSQISEDGTYVQHSTNYHRLLLMEALWMQLLLEKDNLILEDAVLNKLAAATQWLAVRLDNTSGHVPNLGHNDGSHVLPFTNMDFQDYRPIVQAASRAFLARPALPPGPWDDLCLWLDLPVNPMTSDQFPSTQALDHLILRDNIENRQGWAALRAATFTSRPAHADQLHVDIWHKGMNFAMDAGTFKYNAPPPWENALAATRVHNTIVVDGQDQMTRAGKFLWLDWAQARVEQLTPDSITAIHFGYQRLGVLHRRKLQKGPAADWIITDDLLPTADNARDVKAELNWLVPDWPYELHAGEVKLRSRLGIAIISFSSNTHAGLGILDIFRSGESITGAERISCLGWYSPTYGLKQPALSMRFTLIGQLPMQISTVFHLPA